MRTGWLCKGLVVVGLAVGCATVNTTAPPSAERVAAAEKGIQAARDSGASQDPQAARYLKTAEAELAQAKNRINVRDNRGAELQLARAEADADLSQVLYRQVRATDEATTTEAQLKRARSATTTPGGGTPPVPTAPSVPPTGPLPVPAEGAPRSPAGGAVP